MIELQPWAMLPNGPMWTSAGCPSTVCARFGFMASRKRAISDPMPPTSPAVTGFRSAVHPTTMSVSLCLRSE